MMSEAAFRALVAKIEREYPVRLALAKELGIKLRDETLAELYLAISLTLPERAADALAKIRTVTQKAPVNADP